MAKKDDGRLVFFGKVDGEYDLQDLLRSYAEVMGKGTFGTTYKTILESKSMNKIVAVKILKLCGLPDMEFSKNIEKLGKMVHENLISIRSCYYSQEEALLVSDYMRMGSLAIFLHGIGATRKSSPPWEVRCSIAYGVARGIAYIHSQGPNVCHGNIRSSNVLLTDSLDARVSDFCMSQLVQEETKLSLIAGYCAPEVTNVHEVTQKSDVYSFGVLLLELLTGKAPTDAVGATQGQELSKWVRLMFQEKPILAVFDDMLLRHNDMSLKYANNGEQMVKMLELAVCSTFENPKKRPSMVAVTNRIKHICGF